MWWPRLPWRRPAARERADSPRTWFGSCDLPEYRDTERIVAHVALDCNAREVAGEVAPFDVCTERDIPGTPRGGDRALPYEALRDPALAAVDLGEHEIDDVSPGAVVEQRADVDQIAHAPIRALEDPVLSPLFESRARD